VLVEPFDQLRVVHVLINLRGDQLNKYCMGDVASTAAGYPSDHAN
jgi:hypothetical protein